MTGATVWLWQRTEYGMDMVTWILDEWSVFDGVKVASGSHARRDGSEGVYARGQLVALRWDAPAPKAEGP